MLGLLTLILVVTVPIHGRLFNNPILGEGDSSDPGAIKVDGIYYIVTSTNHSLPEKFPIYISTDLSNWKKIGHIFDELNIPRWSDPLQPFLSPRIQKIGSNYHVYFTATDSDSDLFSIGVAVAPHPAGPYTATDRPLLSDTAGNVHDASIIEDKSDFYLIWVTQNAIKGRMLNSNGLSFYAAYSTKLIRSNPEERSISGPWHTTRGPYHYLMYSLNDNGNQSLEAARSSYALGPYEHQNVSFTSEDFVGVGHVSLVNDLENNPVIVYHAYKTNEVGLEFPRVTVMASFSWTNFLGEQTVLYYDPYGNPHYG